MDAVFWTPSRLLIAVKIIKKHNGMIRDALEDLSEKLGVDVTYDSVYHALKRNGTDLDRNSKLDVNRQSSNKYWTLDKVLLVLQETPNHKTIEGIGKAVKKKYKLNFNQDSFRSALRRYGLESKYFMLSRNKKEYSKYLKTVKDLEKKYKKAYNEDYANLLEIPIKSISRKGITKNSDENEIVIAVVDYIKSKSRSRLSKVKNGTSLRELCDYFDCSPKKMELIVNSAKAKGYRINLLSDTISIDTKVPVQKKKKVVKLSRVEKDRIRLAVMSDTHYGAKACLKDEIKSFVDLAYNKYGVRNILHCGDVLAGNKVYKGQTAELEVWGCTDQCNICAESLPKKNDLRYIYILGNHDIDFMKSNGADPAIILSGLRDDMHFIGALKGNFYIKDCDIEIELAHIKSSAHARSYSLEKHVYRTVSDFNRPDIIFCGHRHTNGYFEVQGLHNFLVPCFEDENYHVVYNDFCPSVGGLIVDIVLNVNNEILQCEPKFIIHRKRSKKYRHFDLDVGMEELN